MNRSIKISIVVSTLAVVGYLIYRNRKPKLKIIGNINWSTKTVEVKFGNTTNLLNGSGRKQAGLGFSDRFTLNYVTKGDQMVISVVKKDGEIMEKKTIDFRNKLIY